MLGALLATHPQRPASPQRVGGPECRDPSTDHRQHGRLHQQPTRRPDAVPTGGTGPDRADHGGAGQRPVPALRAGAGDCGPLEHRVAVFAGLFAAVQLDRAVLEVGEKMLLARQILSHLSGIQKCDSRFH